jgi:hypothetical protein
MSNTVDTALIVDSVTEATQTVLAKRLAALNLFSTDFSSDVKRAGDVVQVALATAGSTTQVNPTSFNSIGGSTLDNAAVTLEHIYQPFGLGYADIKNGIRLERLIKVNVNAFADKIWEKVTTHVTTANYGAAVVEAADSALTPGSAGIKALWAAVSKSDRKGLVSNAGVYANFIPTSTQSLPLVEGAYGFDNGVHYASSFSGQARLAAFSCSPEAMAIASSAPALDGIAGELLVNEAIALPNLGMTAYWTVWSDKTTRNIVAAVEVMFGSAPGIKTDTLAIALNPAPPAG